MRSVILAIILSVNLNAAIARVGSAALGLYNGTTTGNVAYTVTAGSTLIALQVVGNNASDVEPACSYAGVSMGTPLKIDPNAGGTPNRWQYAFVLTSPATGNNNFVCTAGSSIQMILEVSEYSGTSVGALDNSTTQGANAGIVTTTLTTVANNAWTLLFVQGYSGGTPCESGDGGLCSGGPTIAHRVIFDGTDNISAIYDSNGPVTPAGSTSLTGGFTSFSYDTTGIMISIAPAGAPPGGASNSPSKGGIF